MEIVQSSCNWIGLWVYVYNFINIDSFIIVNIGMEWIKAKKKQQVINKPIKLQGEFTEEEE